MGDTREITIDSLKNKLLSVLRIDDFWKQFMEVIGEELAIQRDNLSKKKYLYDVDVQLEDGLIDIAEMFGYTPNLIVDNSLSLVRKEVESIPYRIRNKTAYDGYYVNFKQINRLGEIYNYYWSGKKLIRAIVYTSIVDSLNSIDLTMPFTEVWADKNFSTISYMNPVYLDSGYDLDGKNGQVLWHLDSDAYILPTKHLGIEYYVTEMLDDEYLITSKYFRYMEEGVAYTKRVPIVPHVGVQLIAPMIQNTGFDYLNENLDYTVPALQMKCGTVFQFNKNFVSFDLFRLDDSRTLDETTLWKLDNNAVPTETITVKDFKYISCGNGKLNLPATQNMNLFDYANMVLFYTFGDNDDSVLINDYSSRQTHASIVGDTKKVNGIIGRTVNFNGETYVHSDSTIIIIQDIFTLGFWFTANNKNSYGDTEVQYLIDFNFLKVWYVYSEEKLYYSFGTQNGSIVDVIHDTIYQILFEVDNPNEVLNIYLNTVLKETLDISSEGISGSYYVTIGADSNGEHLFNGLIDSFWIMSKLYSVKEKNYIYNNKLGIIVQLANKMAVYDIDVDNETYENDLWMLIQSYCSANDIKQEFGFFVDNTKEVYTGKINFVPVLTNYFNFVYIDNDNNKITIYADKDGNFYNKDLNSFISGQIDYETGEFTIYKKTEKYKTQQVIGSTTKVRQLVIQRTDTSTEEISYFELVNDALSPLGTNKLIDLTDAVEEKRVLKLPLIGDARYSYVYDNGSKDEAGNPVYYIDFYCTEIYYNYYYNESHEIVEIDSTVDVDNPAEINIYYNNTLVTTPLINLSASLESDIKPYTLGLRYTIGGIYFSAQDNGEGLVTGNHFYGQIDYATGLLTGEFSDGYYPDGDILAFYTYYYSLHMKDGSTVYFNYKVRNSLDITEIGLENENHELLVYMTCAPIQFNSINNHVSVLFAIRKN